MERPSYLFKYENEWRKIAALRRKHGGILQGKADESSLIPGPEPEPEQSSAGLGTSREKSYSDQDQCPLFKLPLELRWAIWEYAVGGHEIRVRWKKKSILVGAGPATLETNLLSMLMSCKRLYIEVLPTLYGCNSFEFWHMRSFYHFLRLSPMTGLQSIRSIKIPWGGFSHWKYHDRKDEEMELNHNESWQEMCGVIHAMKNLRRLALLPKPPLSKNLKRTTIASPNIMEPLKGLPTQVEVTLIIRLWDSSHAIAV
ncbi:hypothetical protein GGR52DRAFT_572504 [Hypoxylon sp. FL1284]|nr:hypothetical protein GGR52DRAFT_572504 [Hypoxylon sp. FL1284]